MNLQKNNLAYANKSTDIFHDTPIPWNVAY